MNKIQLLLWKTIIFYEVFSAKMLIMLSKSTFQAVSRWSDKIARSFNLSCPIVILIKFIGRQEIHWSKLELIIWILPLLLNFWSIPLHKHQTLIPMDHPYIFHTIHRFFSLKKAYIFNNHLIRNYTQCSPIPWYEHQTQHICE